MESYGNITVMLLILELPARYVPARHYYYTSEPNNIVIADQRHCQCHVSHHFKTKYPDR